MSNQPYLWQLTARLAEGVSRLPEAARARHAGYLKSAQNSDGGFSGREGDSDLYYTAFALRGLAVLGALTSDVSDPAAAYLGRCLTQQASVIDFFSLLYACFLIQASDGPDVLAGSAADWPERVAQLLETFRTADGGYAKAAGGVSGSTYHTFLVGLCYQLLGKPLPRPGDVVRFLAARRRDDGGYVEIAPMRRSGTNPTAAAVGTLQLLTGDEPAAVLDPDVRAALVTFLAAMPSAEGGFRANDRAPLADLLSTFTGAWTLHQLGAIDRVHRDQVLKFVRALDLPAGGFRGGLWDDRTDVEYTFYGLGVSGLLA